MQNYDHVTWRSQHTGNRTKAADERNKAHISWFDFEQENINFVKVSISLLYSCMMKMEVRSISKIRTLTEK